MLCCALCPVLTDPGGVLHAHIKILISLPSLGCPRLRAARRRFVGNFSEESEAGNIVVIVVITVFSAAAAAT